MDLVTKRSHFSRNNSRGSIQRRGRTSCYIPYTTNRLQAFILHGKQKSPFHFTFFFLKEWVHFSTGLNTDGKFTVMNLFSVGRCKSFAKPREYCVQRWHRLLQFWSNSTMRGKYIFKHNSNSSHLTDKFISHVNRKEIHRVIKTPITRMKHRSNTQKVILQLQRFSTLLLYDVYLCQVGKKKAFFGV